MRLGVTFASWALEPANESMKKKKKKTGKSERPSPQYLVILWRQERNRIGPSREERLAVLRRFAGLRTRNGTTREVRRLAFRRCHRERGKVGTCWCCSTVGILIEHHVIQFQHGGTNWHLNREWICEACHADIHEWLREATPINWGQVNTKPTGQLHWEIIQGHKLRKARRQRAALDAVAANGQRQFVDLPRLVKRNA